MSAPELTFDLGPVRCPVDGCWAAFGIPDQYTTARENALAAHLMSDEHRQNATSFTIAAPAQPEQRPHCNACGLPHDLDGWPAEVCRRVGAYGGVYGATRPDPAQPEQPLRQRIAQAIVADLQKAIPPLEVAPGRSIGGMGRTEFDVADAVLAAVQPDLAARDAKIQQLRAAEDDLHRRLNDIETLCDHAESAALANWQNPQPVPQWAVDVRAICRREPTVGPRPTT